MDTELTRKVTESLNQLVDEETTRRLGELNIVTEVAELQDGSISIRFQPLSPYSPLSVNMGREIRKAALAVPGVKSVQVECSGHLMDSLVNRLVNSEPGTK